jgi:bifunctional DNase/RNase
MPVILLRDRNGRTLTVPLNALEAELIAQNLEQENKGPQPYRLLLSCLEELGVDLFAVRIFNSPALQFRTRLILHTKAGPEIEVPAPCAEAVACASLAGVPIYVDIELMEAISHVPSRG